MKRRRNVEAFNLSFLDCICCGFGAIILLLVLSRIYEPVAIDKTQNDLEQLIVRLQKELVDVRGQTTVINRDLESVSLQASSTEKKLAQLQGELSTVRGQFAASTQNSESTIDEGALQSSKQSLTAEMRALEPYYRRADNDAVAGIAVDSEYIIFVIDTSGSMQQYSWDKAQRKLAETLEVYPQVKGIQVMNNNGSYMFQQYRGKWIPDTPGRRQAILNTMRSWRPFSDSNPADGIIFAISEFGAPDKKISIYVFGDEFTGRSIERVVQQVDAVNREDASGHREVRINAVGFPLLFQGGGQVPPTAHRYSQLMRILCERNGGTFVALTDARG